MTTIVAFLATMIFAGAASYLILSGQTMLGVVCFLLCIGSAIGGVMGR